ncbi:recombinase family protein [Vagococcus fluvialis]|uniref:Recombinase family protein n=1 Tax=Vagococcus fluvialis TaxID=2738 RepID=A0A7X6I3C2_9ENTE|nr:recombinase family protein [Vagococcus fluvialis]NKC68423.1 recombinase family protein [Vagococcus fluvialis]
MGKMGYVYLSIDESYVKEQIEAIQNFGVKQTIFDEKDIMKLKSGSELVIYELKSLGKSLTQMPAFFLKLTKKNIHLTIIQKDDSLNYLTDEQYFAILSDLAEMDRFIISERTTKGIQEAKRSGRIGGRPRISEEKIKEIKYLYHKQSYTLREIVEKCDVSLGTAYKYIHD